MTAVVEGQGWTLDAAIVAVAGVGLTFGLWWGYFTLPSGLILHHFRSRSWVWGYGHILVFAAIAATGAGLHVVALVVEGESHLSESAAVLAVAIPVLVYLMPCSRCTPICCRTFDPFHIGLLVGTIAFIVLGVVLAEAGCRAVGVPDHGDLGAIGGGGRLRDHRASARGELAAPDAQLSRARAWAIAFSTRFSDTGTLVRNGWANRLTRSSSSSQPMSSTKSGSRPGGAAAHSSA